MLYEQVSGSINTEIESRGYYIAIVGKDESQIEEYIKKQ